VKRSCKRSWDQPQLQSVCETKSPELVQAGQRKLSAAREDQCGLHGQEENKQELEVTCIIEWLPTTTAWKRVKGLVRGLVGSHENEQRLFGAGREAVGVCRSNRLN
jgi:hypothetical protein